ncbi:MAG TPA: ATP-grasp domain-containing protein, partial [Synergistales bacterium]|nr:ATP-grasp domain-containing protein [Synergistales bacterium]
MKVLLLGNGAREHAMAWALRRSPLVTSLTIAPGNSGTAMLGENVHLDPTNIPVILDLVSEKKIDLVVVGPEAPLVMGISDACREKGIPVFGPGKKGALLEGSKAYSKNFMKRYGIPTAPFDICTNMEEVLKALKNRTAPYVVKADGLAAGKGAFIIDDLDEALLTAEELLSGKKLGKAGETLVIEDCLPGMELTVLAITDGKEIRALSPSQDHKRIFNDDLGP